MDQRAGESLCFSDTRPGGEKDLVCHLPGACEVSDKYDPSGSACRYFYGNPTSVVDLSGLDGNGGRSGPDLFRYDHQSDSGKYAGEYRKEFIADVDRVDVFLICSSVFPDRSLSGGRDGSFPAGEPVSDGGGFCPDVRWFPRVYQDGTAGIAICIETLQKAIFKHSLEKG